MYMCPWKYKSEVNLGSFCVYLGMLYVCMHMCVGSHLYREQSMTSLSSVALQVNLWGTKPGAPVDWTSRVASFIGSKSWDCRSDHRAWLFMCVLSIQTQVLILAWPAFYQLCHILSPHLAFWDGKTQGPASPRDSFVSDSPCCEHTCMLPHGFYVCGG